MKTKKIKESKVLMIQPKKISEDELNELKIQHPEYDFSNRVWSGIMYRQDVLKLPEQ